MNLLPSDSLIKHYTKDEETGEVVPVRYMNDAEILERLELNQANTASAQRARVLQHLYKSNGFVESMVRKED